MEIVASRYHPYRAAASARDHDQRAARVALEILDAKKVLVGSSLTRELAAIQAREYGSMSDVEFRHRTVLVRSLSELRDDWSESGQQVFEPKLGEEQRTGFSVIASRLQLEPFQSVYVHLADRDVQEAHKVEGVYLKRVGQGGDETCLLITVFAVPPREHEATLGQTLREHSRIVIAIAPSLAHDAELELIDGDRQLLATMDLQLVFRSFLNSLGVRSPRGAAVLANFGKP